MKKNEKRLPVGAAFFYNVGRLRRRNLIRLAYGEPPSPNRGRLIYASTSLANIHLEETAYRYLLHRGAKFHHGKVKAS